MQYWAAARDAAGCSREQLTGETLEDVIAAAGRLHGERLSTLLGICSFLIDGSPAKRADAGSVRLESGAVIEVLPPFAGGSA